MRTLTFSVLAMTSALALSACREDQTAEVPLQAPPAAGSGLLGALGLADLPPAPPAPIVRTSGADYGWAERAYQLDQAFYQAPPDYGFDYDGIEPWAWESEDDWRLVAEPLSSGYRYYYYEPGADYPYFVRDPDYGYGYDRSGGLAAVYDMGGVLLPRAVYAQRADAAGRYWSRAHALRQASARERRREVETRQWSLRRAAYERSQAPWLQAAERHPEWSRYRAGRDDGEARRLRAERERRAAAIARISHEDRREAHAWRQEQNRQRADWRQDRAEQDRRAAVERERDRHRIERDAARHRVESERRQVEERRADQRRIEQRLAERERRGRDEAQRRQAEQQRQQAERQRGEQRRAEADRRRQEGAQRHQQARAEQARHAEQAGRLASGRERGEPRGGRGGGEHHREGKN